MVNTLGWQKISEVHEYCWKQANIRLFPCEGGNAMVEGIGRQTDMRRAREEERIRKERSGGKKRVSGKDTEQINHCRHRS